MQLVNNNNNLFTENTNLKLQLKILQEKLYKGIIRKKNHCYYIKQFISLQLHKRIILIFFNLLKKFLKTFFQILVRFFSIFIEYINEFKSFLKSFVEVFYT